MTLKMSADGSSFSKNHSIMHKALLLIGSTTSSLVAVTFFVFLAYRRDVLMVLFFIGAISNGILSKVLKKLLNQERPTAYTSSSSLIQEKPEDKGMPSSHAMSLGFIGTFTALTVPWTMMPIVLYVLVSLYYRVQTSLHTQEQVAVGLIIGASNGAFWRALCDGKFPFPLVDWVSRTILDDNGLLPIPYLVVPVVVGAAVVGSFERRISKWFNSKTKES